MARTYAYFCARWVGMERYSALTPWGREAVLEMANDKIELTLRALCARQGKTK